MWRCGIGTSNRSAFTNVEIPAKLWNSDCNRLPVLLLALAFLQEKKRIQIFLTKEKQQLLPWQSIICQHFPKNVNALLFQQRRGIMICSSSCAREPSWENDVCHDVSRYISLWLAGENEKYAPPTTKCHRPVTIWKSCPRCHLIFSHVLPESNALRKTGDNLFSLNTATLPVLLRYLSKDVWHGHRSLAQSVGISIFGWKESKRSVHLSIWK